jgi:DNA repair protein SbcD/Mre11
MDLVRIVHTADNHIGLKFKGRSYNEALRERLVQERFEALQRVVDLANARNAHFLVIAGDLFDSTNVAQRDIKGVVDVLKKFAGEYLVVLPGNHDFYEAGDGQLWENFRKFHSGHQLLLLNTSEPVGVELGERKVVFFPGPCVSKHSETNAIGWVAGARKDADALNIGVAHGSVEGVSPDFDSRYYPMSPQQLRRSGVGFWLLGHSHIRYPDTATASGETLFIPSTHTPDGFDCTHPGHVWCLDVDGRGNVKAESCVTGAMRFYDWQKTLHSATDLAALKGELEALSGVSSLVRLELTGRLSQEDHSTLTEFVKGLSATLAYCEVSTSGVSLNITREYIDATFPADSLPHQLLSRLAEHPEDALALQLAYEVMAEGLS